jgi:hypothetical protein
MLRSVKNVNVTIPVRLHQRASKQSKMPRKTPPPLTPTSSEPSHPPPPRKSQFPPVPLYLHPNPHKPNNFRSQSPSRYSPRNPVTIPATPSIKSS